MYLMIGGKWRAGYCEYERYEEDHVKIAVSDWYLIDKVASQYISYPKDWRILYNYVRDVGLRATWLKIRSRLKERGRNSKYVALGLGVVEEANENSDYANGQRVIFLATNHPECASKVVVPGCMVAAVSGIEENITGVRFHKKHGLDRLEKLKKYGGWSPFSGAEVDSAAIKAALNDAYQQISAKTGKSEYQNLSIKPESTERAQIKPDDDRMRAALFGLGNYAKVFIIPNLDKRISLRAVHEIDPAQIGLEKWGEGYCSTSAKPRANENFDIYFAAGYHHTHAEIAIHALERDACAVVEKPVATTLEQLNKIEKLLESSKGSLFACFHKRYSKLNDWALEDLGKEEGDAIDYHCIVYEIALPAGHWYNWKNAGSRIVSNGCHWIDHFMFLNDYKPAKKFSVSEASRGQILVQIELENSALFSMMLTDTGSPRLGVRDYIELRKGKTTVYMTDSSEYRSENQRGWIRSKKINKINAYGRMYAAISSTIADKAEGDSVISLRSSRMVLQLEELLLNQRQG